MKQPLRYILLLGVTAVHTWQANDTGHDTFFMYERLTTFFCDHVTILSNIGVLVVKHIELRLACLSSQTLLCKLLMHAI